MIQLAPSAPRRFVPPISLVEPEAAPRPARAPASAEAPPRTWLQQLSGKVRRNLARGPSHLALKGLRFVTSEARSRLTFHAAAQLGLGVRIVGRSPSLQDLGGTLVIGDAVVFSGPVTPIRLELAEGAVLSIGDQSFLNDGVWLGCTQRMAIGRRVLFGPGVRCLDNDYHGLYQRRVRPPARPITIEDDAWLASGCIILPGVTVGRGAVIAAGAVVVSDVAPYTVVAGNPARPVKVLDRARFEAGQG